MSVAIAAEDPHIGTTGGSRAIQPHSLRTIRFNLQPSITIPPGAEAISDPASVSVLAKDIISVSLYLRHGQAGHEISSHPGSRTDTWIARGDLTRGETMPLAGQHCVNTPHWYFLSGVEAWVAADHGSFAFLGDSLTDGRISTDNLNNRWPDMLYDRFHDAEHLNSRLAFVNQSLGGNRVLSDGVGPSAWSRIERDILALKGLRYVLIFIGVNDIGTADLDTVEVQADRLIEAYQQIILQVRTKGAAVFGATLPPFNAPQGSDQPYAHPARVNAWYRVNRWIKFSGDFDAVVDMAAVLGESENPDRLRAEFDSGDYLHPNLEGFRAMADAFPLALLQDEEGFS